MTLADFLLIALKLKAAYDAAKGGQPVPFHISHRVQDEEDVIEGTYTRRKIPPAQG